MPLAEVRINLGIMLREGIAIETLKLLVQVAWADREVDQKEADSIFSIAQEIGLGEAGNRTLRAALREAGTLQEPDLRKLRENRVDVLRAVDLLIAADGVVLADERAARDAISDMLSDDS